MDILSIVLQIEIGGNSITANSSTGLKAIKLSSPDMTSYLIYQAVPEKYTPFYSSKAVLSCQSSCCFGQCQRNNTYLKGEKPIRIHTPSNKKHRHTKMVILWKYLMRH